MSKTFLPTKNFSSTRVGRDKCVVNSKRKWEKGFIGLAVDIFLFTYFDKLVHANYMSNDRKLIYIFEKLFAQGR